jgi:hypothetical protein
MELVLPLDEMTLSDKLQAMEQIWDDLCREPENIPSPDWHGDILQAREKRVERGSAQFKDWPEAKEKIRASRK